MSPHSSSFLILCMYTNLSLQFNHRSWADMFMDQYIAEGHAVALSRGAVLLVFPFFMTSMRAIRTVIIFNRGNIGNIDVRLTLFSALSRHKNFISGLFLTLKKKLSLFTFLSIFAPNCRNLIDGLINNSQPVAKQRSLFTQKAIVAPKTNPYLSNAA